MPEAESPPKTGLLTSIDQLTDGIFNQPIAERTAKEEVAAKRLMENKPPSDPPPVAPAPGVRPDEKHEDDLVIDGLKIEQPVEIKSEQGVRSWKGAKDAFIKKSAEYEKRIKDMETRLSTGPSPEILQAHEAKLAELQKERDDLNERLGRASIERTPEFERHYVKRQVQVIEDVKAAVGKDHAEKVEAILQMPDGAVRNAQVNELLADMDELQKIEIGNAVKELRQISKEKKEQVENWKAGLTQREKMLAEQQESQTKNYAKAFDVVLKDFQKENPLFAPKEGDSAWNDRANKLTELAREAYLGKGTPHDRAKGSMYAVYSTVLFQALKEQNEEMAKLTKQLEGLRGKQPVVDGSGGSDNRPGGAPGGKAESMAERISRMAKESGAVK